VNAYRILMVGEILGKIRRFFNSAPRHEGTLGSGGIALRIL
jgi:hypothetical protein